MLMKLYRRFNYDTPEMRLLKTISRKHEFKIVSRLWAYGETHNTKLGHIADRVGDTIDEATLIWAQRPGKLKEKR